jgi:hypothetical protein
VQERDAPDHVFVKNAHLGRHVVGPGFEPTDPGVEAVDPVPNRRKFITHLRAELRNLRREVVDASG